MPVADAPDGLLLAVRNALAPLMPELRLEWVEQVDSTNTALLERAREGCAQATLLVARSQTAGRGRQGKTWAAASDASLTFSLALRVQRQDLSGLSLAIGAALAHALDAPHRPPPASRLVVKWPNDLWLTGAAAAHKLGGVLIETQGVGAQRWVVIGVGLNVRDWDAPRELEHGLACLNSLDPQATPLSTLAQVAPALVAAILRFDDAGFAAFADSFAARDWLRGKPVRTSDGDTGVADGVDSDGSLRLLTEHGLRRVRSGDVSVRPGAAVATV